VIPSYRFIPRYFYPDQREDVQHALSWVYQNIESYGGDPERIYISGHSAGGYLAALEATKSDWLKRFSLPVDLIKGCVPISAPYDMILVAEVTPESPVLAEFFRETDLKEASPIFNIKNILPEFLVAVGSLEKSPTLGTKSSEDFVKKIQDKGGQAELLVLDGMNHADTVLALGNEKSELFKAIIKMIKRM